MAYRRYRRRRLRPRRYFRRRLRRHIRRYRRRFPIMRRRAGAYYLEKFSHTGPLTITTTANQLTKSGAVYWTLAEFFSSSPRFDYYKIKYASWSLVPATPVTGWTNWGKGTTIVDYDDHDITQNPTSLAFTANATTRWWRPQRGVRRMVRPKPVMTEGPGNYWQPRVPWMNSLNNSLKWLGIKYSISGPQPASWFFMQTKTIWVLWKNVL